MAKLPKSIIKKYGISKKAWAVFRGTRKIKKHIKTGGKIKMARRHYKKHRSSKSSSGFGFGSALKILGGAAIAVAYEVFVSPMIPLSQTIKNIVELALGLFLMSMKGMPTMVRAGGAALATINAYALIYPLISGMGGSSSSISTGGVSSGYI